MSDFAFILADGISPGMIFAIFFAILIAFANMMAKKKQADQTVQEMKNQREARRRSAPHQQRGQVAVEEARRAIQEAAELAAMRERMAGGIAAQERAKAKRKKTPPPMPVARPAQTPPVPRPAMSEPVLAGPSPKKQNEAAKNVRLMLQPAGIREAFVLSEVLGKPKSLRDD